MTEIQQRYDVDQVRERTDLLALIGQHVALKKRGGRYTGLCPFHQEKSPSFSVDPQKGFWHCFGCGKGGDAFTFVMQLEHLNFPEAVERLAERAGVRPIESFEPVQRKEERDFLFEANAAAATAFSTALRGKAGGAAREYLAARGISLEQAAQFGLGYAPRTWDALVNHLGKRGFSLDVLAKAGLVLARTRGDGYIDRFRHRLIIPIYNRQGRVIAFGGRAMVKEDQPKYLNTAETPIFHKSRTLYALHLAADTIAKKGRAIVTEGYFDVIACHLAGFTETVATLGTALGEEHVQILRRLAERVYLVFDADSAGMNAALRSQALFREAEVDVRIVRLPAGHDPDTLIRDEGAAAFEQCLEQAMSPVEFELVRLVESHPVHDAEGRVRLFRAAAKILQPLSKIARAEYALRLIERAAGVRGDVAELQQALLSEVAALDRAPRRSGGAPEPSRTASEPRVGMPADVPLEREILTAMAQQAEFMQRAVSMIAPEALSHPVYREIFLALHAQVQRGEAPDLRRIFLEDAQVMATIAALSVREPLPIEALSPDDMLARLRDEYERISVLQSRQVTAEQAAKAIEEKIATDAPADAADIYEWTERIRKRSQEAAKRIFDQET